MKSRIRVIYYTELCCCYSVLNWWSNRVDKGWEAWCTCTLHICAMFICQSMPFNCTSAFAAARSPFYTQWKMHDSSMQLFLCSFYELQLFSPLLTKRSFSFQHLWLIICDVSSQTLASEFSSTNRPVRKPKIARPKTQSTWGKSGGIQTAVRRKTMGATVF